MATAPLPPTPPAPEGPPPPASAPPAGEWLFGRYRLVPASRRLHSGERRMELDPRALAVLECLLRQADSVVPRAHLIAEAWPGAEAVFDSAVSKVMRRLRVALGDPHGNVLQTIYGEGYRLALPATLLPPMPAPAAHRPPGLRNGAAHGQAASRDGVPAPSASTSKLQLVPDPGKDDAGIPRHGPRAAWRVWLPWTIAALASLLAGCLAWLLYRAGVG